MHVAICDDNVADRKHMERLLSRESDKRAGTPNILYIDSYGDKNHFLRNPLKYNIIFMDMCSEPGIVEEILAKLEQMGYHAPLILYSSKIDYTAIPNLPDYVVHAKKPYIPAPLPDFLKLGDANVIGNVVTVPVHQNGILQLIPKNNVMYAMPNGNKYRLFMLDGTTMEVDEEISELRQIFEPYEEFKRINKKNIVNFKYVSAVMPFSVLMQNDCEFRISLLNYHEFKWLKEDID